MGSDWWGILERTLGLGSSDFLTPGASYLGAQPLEINRAAPSLGACLSVWVSHRKIKLKDLP